MMLVQDAAHGATAGLATAGATFAVEGGTVMGAHDKTTAAARTRESVIGLAT
jgi:hypothetical protein